MADLNENKNNPKQAGLTEAGHPYLSPIDAMFKIIQGEKNWCTSNFLRGLFGIKLILATMTASICLSCKIDSFIGCIFYLIFTFIIIFLLVEVKLKIDVVKVFKTRRLPYIKHMPQSMAFYFFAYYGIRYAFDYYAKKLAKRSVLQPWA